MRCSLPCPPACRRPPLATTLAPLPHSRSPIHALLPVPLEALLRSPHRVASPDDADFFYIPTYLSCAILPVYDYTGPADYQRGGRDAAEMRPAAQVTLHPPLRFPDAARDRDAHAVGRRRPRARPRARTPPLPSLPPRPLFSPLTPRLPPRRCRPHWDRSAGRDHIVLLSHDEGGCWAPRGVAANAIILSHWGRMDAQPHSSSRYMADNWESDWKSSIRAPDGAVWRCGGTLPAARCGRLSRAALPGARLTRARLAAAASRAARGA